MSGHNKWSKIKHKKAASDAKKSNTFSRYSRQITAEVKTAGGDEGAAAVRAVIEKAKAASMPSENINRAIERGRGALSGALSEVVYEAYGPAGVGILIIGLTDNKNRSAADVKHALSVFGLSLAEPGAASWAFTKVGAEWEPTTTIPTDSETIEKIENITEKLEALDDITAVYTNADVPQEG